MLRQQVDSHTDGVVQWFRTREAVNHFEDFYEEVFMELAKFGELEEVVVADNIGDHLIGSVYVKFVTEE